MKGKTAHGSKHTKDGAKPREGVGNEAVGAIAEGWKGRSMTPHLIRMDEERR